MLRTNSLALVIAISTLAVQYVSAASCGVIENNTDFQGNDLANAPASSAEDCCPICNANPSCTGFAFGWGTCFLKYGPLVRISKVGVSAGVHWLTHYFEHNADLHDDDLILFTDAWDVVIQRDLRELTAVFLAQTNHQRGVIFIGEPGCADSFTLP
ncbi:hypothetical protein B5M09_004682, partial [Aphanomyces astaci]